MENCCGHPNTSLLHLEHKTSKAIYIYRMFQEESTIHRENVPLLNYIVVTKKNLISKVTEITA